MPHYVSYDPRTGEITGSVHSNDPIDLVDGADQAFAEVSDQDHLDALEPPSPSRLLRGRVDGGLLVALRSEPRYRGTLELRCDRPDLDGDGRAEIASDGRMEARIVAVLADDAGEPVGDGTEIAFRVTRGRLSARRATCTGGETAVTLRSVTETVTALVTATADGFPPASLEIEFVPADELRELRAAQGD